mgnify:CR=1 FL=1|tara:strand:- start:288 stop:482 length:195 start_codon:yes stop_codon:yes gene_type:complete
MKEIKIEVSNCSSKQWATLLIELNLMKNQWKKYGPLIKINAPGLNRVIAWGRKRNKVEKNDESD